MKVAAICLVGPAGAAKTATWTQLAESVLGLGGGPKPVAGQPAPIGGVAALLLTRTFVGGELVAAVLPCATPLPMRDAGVFGVVMAVAAGG